MYRFRDIATSQSQSTRQRMTYDTDLDLTLDTTVKKIAHSDLSWHFPVETAKFSESKPLNKPIDIKFVIYDYVKHIQNK